MGSGQCSTPRPAQSPCERPLASSARQRLPYGNGRPVHREKSPKGLARTHAEQGKQSTPGLKAEVTGKTKLRPALALMVAPLLPVEPLHGLNPCLARPPAEAERAKHRLRCQRPLFRTQVRVDAAGSVRTVRCPIARGARNAAQASALVTLGQRPNAETNQRAMTGVRRTSRANSEHCSWVGCEWRLAASCAPPAAS